MSKIRVRNRQNRYGILFSLRCQVFRALADSADKWARDLRSDSRCGRQDAVAAGASPFSIPRGLPRGGSLRFNSILQKQVIARCGAIHTMIATVNALKQRFQEAAKAAYGLDNADPVLVEATRPEFGDFQFNAALGLAKALGAPPRAIAEKIVAHLTLD